MDIERYRAEFPITQQYTYLNNAAIAPLNQRAAHAMQEYVGLKVSEPFEHWFEYLTGHDTQLKERSASLINAERPDEIVSIPNTGTAINIAAAGLPLRPGDNVLVLEGDYPAVIYPWLNLAPRGILTKIVPSRHGGLDLETLQSRIDARTRVIALSTAMFATGYRNDIAAVGAICRQRGIFFVVDAIQTLGVFPLDVRACHIDFLACGGHKWLLGVMGAGILYCRHDLLDHLQLGAYVGAASTVDPFNFLDYNFTLQPTSERFSVGVPNEIGIAALATSLGLILEIGIERIAHRVLALTGTLIGDLQDRGFSILSNLEPEHRSASVVIEVPDPEAVCQRLLDERILASPRGTGVRFSPNFYNNEEDVLRVGAALGQSSLVSIP